MQYQQRKDVLTIVQMFFWLSLLLLIVVTPKVFAFPLPDTITEGDELTVNFVDTNAELHRNSVLVATSSPYVWQTTNADAGLYIFEHFVNGTLNHSETVEVLDLTVSFSIEEPADDHYTTNTVPVRLTTSTTPDFCYTVADGNSNTLNGSGTLHTGELSLSDGIYTVEFKCKFGADLVEQEKTILVDTTAPVISNTAPSANEDIIGDQVTMTLVTDEVATCQNNQGTFTSADRLTHTLVTTLSQESYTYNTTCADTHGNSGSHTFYFTVNNRPSASIELTGDTDILTEGSYPFELTTSEPTQEPTLTFNYQGESARTIALTSGDDDLTWDGYLVIGDVGEQAGSFNVGLIDLTGVSGNELTEGKLFLVDTKAPDAVSNLEVSTDGPDILIEWSDTQTEVEYNIYRSSKPQIAETDYYRTVDTTSYRDTNVDPDGIYYYGVAVVDEAGNLGPLSNVEGALREIVASEDVDERQLYDAEQLKKRVEQTIFDIDAAYQELEAERDQKKITFIEQLQLLERLIQQKATLNADVRELESLPSASSDVFQQRLRAINEHVGDARKIIPKRLLIDGSLGFQQQRDLSIENRLFDRAAALFSIQDRIAYKGNSESLNDQLRVDGQILTTSIENYDKSEEKHTYVAYELSFPVQQTQSALFVDVPSDLADVNDLQISPSPSDKKDGLLRFDVPAGESQFAFNILLNEGRNLVKARSSYAALFAEPASADAAITGYVVKDPLGIAGLFSQNPMYLLGGLAIVVLLFYYFSIDGGSSRSSDEFFRTLTERLRETSPARAQQSATQDPRSYFQREQQFFAKRNPQNKSYYPGRGTPSRNSAPRNAPSTIFPSSRTILPKKTRSAVSAPSTPDVSTQSIPEMLLQAHSAIDNREYIVARNLYQSLLDMEDARSHPDTNVLYNKLLLYQEVQAALSAAEEKDLSRLRQKLENLQSIASIVPENNSDLVSGAKAHYSDLKKLANKLAIDQEVF